ncbi:hypothetical protein [Natronosalvus amylolyticus]|nr:hypothetical protein [Natronosalvus amylolyticus]
MPGKDKGGWYGDSRGHSDAAHQRYENRVQTWLRRVRWKLGDLFGRLKP